MKPDIYNRIKVIRYIISCLKLFVIVLFNLMKSEIVFH